MKFIDSNILVYLADRHDDDKREIAKGVVADAMRYPEGYLISTQALAEFSNVCLRKFKMDIETVRDYLGFLRGLKVVSYLPAYQEFLITQPKAVREADALGVRRGGLWGASRPRMVPSS